MADRDRDRRVAWLLMHRTLREFEVPLLRSLGLSVYTPKHSPREYVRSASIPYKDDPLFPLPTEAVECLNRHNFYDDAMPPEVVEVLNHYFGTVFFCLPSSRILEELTAHFHGRLLLRAFGREHPETYAGLIRVFSSLHVRLRLREIEDRFWLAVAYDEVAEFEKDPWLRRRCVTLPLGLPERIVARKGTWTGGDPRLLFLCPDITASPYYYGLIYRNFQAVFGDVPHLIAGRQGKPVPDPRVVGFVPDDVFSEWLRTLNVMYYHSQEPRHLHYHPLEAIVYGMPVIYMPGGLMERFGGPDQPGACRSHEEARQKVERVLAGDRAFIEDIRNNQPRLLEEFSADYCRRAWQRRFVAGILRDGNAADAARSG